MTPGLMKDVFGNQKTADLLGLLAGAKAPLRYSDARRELALRPQEFQRALNALEAYALVQLRADRKVSPKNAVFLEATLLGRILAEARAKMDKDVAALAKRHGVPKQALEALAAEV